MFLSVCVFIFLMIGLQTDHGSVQQLLIDQFKLLLHDQVRSTITDQTQEYQL